MCITPVPLYMRFHSYLYMPFWPKTTKGHDWVADLVRDTNKSRRLSRRLQGVPRSPLLWAQPPLVRQQAGLGSGGHTLHGGLTLSSGIWHVDSCLCPLGRTPGRTMTIISPPRKGGGGERGQTCWQNANYSVAPKTLVQTFTVPLRRCSAQMNGVAFPALASSLGYGKTMPEGPSVCRGAVWHSCKVLTGVWGGFGVRVVGTLDQWVLSCI